MFDTIVMQHNYRSRNLVTIDNEQSIVNNYIYEKFKFEEAFLVLNPSKTFIGNSRMCRKTEISGDRDRPDFDGKTVLAGCDDNEYIFRSRFEIINFSKEGKILDLITLMGINTIPTATAVGDKYTYFLFDHYQFIENKIKKGTFLIFTNDSVDVSDHHHSKSGGFGLGVIECNQIHNYYPDEEDDEDEDM